MTDMTSKHSDAMTYAAMKRGNGALYYAPSLTGRLPLNDTWNSHGEQTFGNIMTNSYDNYQTVYGVPVRVSASEHLTQPMYLNTGRPSGRPLVYNSAFNRTYAAQRMGQRRNEFLASRGIRG